MYDELNPLKAAKQPCVSGGVLPYLQDDFEKLVEDTYSMKVCGTASFGQIVMLFRNLDNNFNHAFTAGMGASWDDQGNLVDVDGMALFKNGYFETHPYIQHHNGNGYLVRYEGNLFEDTYELSILRRDLAHA